MLYRRLIAPRECYDLEGSDFVFISSASMSVVFLDGGIVTDTTTLSIYRFDGAEWSSGTITNQAASKSGSNYITASGSFTLSGVYGALFQASDSVAPVTSFSIRGASASFDNTAYFSTTTFIVLTSTDPISNGYSTGVSTIYYRVDPYSDDAPFDIYAASFPVPIGVHKLQYRAEDWSGNLEALKTTTFIATTGTVFKSYGSLFVSDRLLVGNIDYGLKADVHARGDEFLSLAVSNPSGSNLLSVTSFGNVGMGMYSANARLELLSTSTATPVLTLRSGSTTSTTTAQIALAYSGDVSMAHRISTQHSTDTVGNRMDFSLWTPAAGSTASAANVSALSLQVITSTFGSVHVRPYGQGHVELEVSDGETTGGGVIERAAAYSPSSHGLKSDIVYLTEAEEVRAVEDLAAMRHVRFRYKNSARYQRGLVFEEAPESVREPKGSVISGDQRLVNSELALKAAIKKLRRLEQRLAELKK